MKVYSSYMTGVEIFLYKTRLSRLETWNVVKNLTRAVKVPSMLHYNAMLKTMYYSVDIA